MLILIGLVALRRRTALLLGPSCIVTLATLKVFCIFAFLLFCLARATCLVTSFSAFSALAYTPCILIFYE